MTVQYIFVLNRQGKVRLSKWFANAAQANSQSRQLTIKKVHRLVSSRDYLGKGQQQTHLQQQQQQHQQQNGSASKSSGSGSSNFVLFDNNTKKLVYRRYNGLFFIFCIELNDNELYYLELIQFFVEVLDEYFDEVCELDMVFNFYSIYYILDEMFLNGELCESSRRKIIDRMDALNSLE